MANGLLKTLGLKKRPTPVAAGADEPPPPGLPSAGAADAGNAAPPPDTYSADVPVAAYKPNLSPFSKEMQQQLWKMGGELADKERKEAEQELARINKALADAKAYLAGLDDAALGKSSYAALMADVRKRFPEAAGAAQFAKKTAAKLPGMKGQLPSPKALMGLVDATVRERGLQALWSLGTGKNLATVNSDRLLAAYMSELPAGVGVKIAGGVVQLTLEGAALSVAVPGGQAEAKAGKDGAAVSLKLNDFAIEVANEGWKEFDPELRGRWKKIGDAASLVLDLKASRDKLKLELEQKKRDGEQITAALNADLEKREAAFTLAWTKLKERVDATAKASEQKISASIAYLKKDANDKAAVKAGVEAEVDLKAMQGQLKAYYANPDLDLVLKVAAAADKVSARLELTAVKTGTVVSAAFERSLEETKAAIEVLMNDGKTQAAVELKKKADELSAKLKLMHQNKDLKLAAELEKTLKEVRGSIELEVKKGATSVKAGASGSSGGEVGGKVQIDIALRDGRTFVGEGDKLSFTANVSNKGYKFEVAFSMGEPVETASLQDLFDDADRQIKELYKLAGDQGVRSIADAAELNRKLQEVMAPVKQAADKAKSLKKKSDIAASFGFSIEGDWPAGGRAAPPAAMFSAKLSF